MEQEPLFFEDIYAALKYAAHRAEFKDTAVLLFPHKKDPETAARYLSDCLNPDRGEKLDIEQVMLILRRARDAGCHVAVNFICQQAGYSRPEPKDPEDQINEIERQLVTGLREQNVLMNRLIAIRGGR